ncbi:Cfr10I/Bse634I family restriction endonuclease [Corallococcus sp. 4LFB]|uniref:Cfr10I/Bse634I family restriction endonuclease n=1 Tax=Corallococcus sp. 4LFB TaxID=3383249 RepID=UPI00397507F6
MAKVEGDVFELLEAAALWEVAVAWNQFMDTGNWNSSVLAQPPGAVAAPDRKVAFVKLPRDYDATLLFTETARKNIAAHESALKLRQMELGLSSPDIVGVRLGSPLPANAAVFCSSLPNLDTPNRELLETAYKRIEGTLSGREFLFAIAVKRTTRSDRLYQPLFEANVLKYLIQDVLRGAAFRFHVHVGSFEGADVEGHYRAASLFSLLRGGEPTLAVDKLVESKAPIQVAQAVLDDLPLFPL